MGSLSAEPRLGLTLSAGGGHDNQILAEPTRGVVEAVSDGFGLLTMDFSATWRRALAADRLNLHVQAQGTEYMSGLLGLDGNLLVDGSWHRLLTRSTSLQVDALGWAFRREGMADFNLNAWRAGGRFAWSLHPALLVAAGGRFQQVAFTERFITPDTTTISGPGDVIVFPVGTEKETDHHTDATLTALWRRGRVYLSADFVYRWSGSNEPLVEYRGPQGSFRVGSRFNRGDLVGYMSLARREFSEPYVVEEELSERRDRVLQLGLFAERSVSGRARLFLDGAWLRQRSDIEQFAFEQFQVQAGVKVSLMEPRRTLRDMLSVAPLPSAEGPVVFRYRGPAAGEVALVGDFNGWDPGAHPMARVSKGLWEVSVPLDPGVWRYAFVVDGQWVTPPEAPRYEDDGFGGRNAVLIVQ